MPISSGCRLLRQAPKFESKNIELCENKTIQNINNLKTWHWPNFLKNKKIVKLFQNNQIAFICGQVSGRLYPKNLMEKICKFIRVNKILYLIQQETIFDEIIFPSLANYYMKTNQQLYCHTFWNKKKSIPNIIDILKILKKKPHIYIIKRFPDNLNDKLYKNCYLNKLKLI